MDEVPKPLQPLWAKMTQLADASRLIDDELPAFGQKDLSGRTLSFVDGSTAIAPTQTDGNLLLGKIGAAGFGDHFGSDTLFAGYRLAGDQSEPVAGFHLTVVAKPMAGFRVSTPP